MDALKKAEEEKKKAAKRLEQVETNARIDETEEDDSEKNLNISGEYSKPSRLTDTMKLSLEPLDIQNREKAAPQTGVPKIEFPEIEAAEPKDIKEATGPTDIKVESKELREDKDVKKETTSELSMEDIGFTEDITMENTVANAAIPEEALEETQQAIDLSDTTIIENLDDDNSAAPFDDTFHGVLFNADEENEDFYEETLPGIPAHQLVQDMGGGKHQPTPVAAQTVFTAGRSKKSSRSNWGIFAVLALLAFGSFGVFYYFTITPVARKLPSPAVARGVESTIVPGAALSQFKAPDVNSGTIIGKPIDDAAIEAVENIISIGEPLAETSTEELLVESEGESSAEPKDVTLQTDVDETLSVDADSTDIAAVETPTPKTIAEVAAREQPAVPEDNIAIDPPAKSFIAPDMEEMKISRSKTPLKQNAMVSEAFKAYKSGELDSAEKLYQNALQDDPENRDIHLGLAAIAINKGDRESAYAHYTMLLDTNPDDALALSALISLSNSSDPVKDESIIKTLMYKEGNVPYLYFALGNIYAKQLRWPEAQEAFFNAYTHDTTNPDYVLNLAVSLDKIGQYATALDFYNVAIELAQRSPVRFSVSSVNDRIQALNKVVEKAL